MTSLFSRLKSKSLDQRLGFLATLATLVGVSLASINSTFAQTFDQPSSPDLSKLAPVSVSAVEIKPENPKPGDTVEVKLKLNISPGFHAYVEQYKLVLKSPEHFYLSEFEVRPTVKFQDPVTKRDKVGTENYAEMVSLLEIPKDTSTGLRPLEFELTYQACSKDYCLFPKKVLVQSSTNISGAEDEMFRRALAQGWLYVLVVIFFAGVLTSLTPCIFPMIPITLAILGTTDHSHSRRRAFTLSLFYVFGIATTYSLLGVLAAKTGSLFGAFLGSPLVVSLVAILFIVMGLSMYGLFEIQMPHFITRRLSNGKTQKSHIGAYGSGLIAGVVASPCVGPVLISVLAYVAQTQNVFLGFVLLFTFALGFGQLFLVIGTYHNFWHNLPKSGPWMENVKFIFGTIMIAMAFYYIRPVTTGPLFDGLSATAIIALAIYFGAFRSKHAMHTRAKRTQQIFMRVLFVLGLLFAVKSMLPPSATDGFFGHADGTTGRKTVHTGPEWFHYSDEMLKQAAAQGKPVIVDFKADWCLSCTELEDKTFSSTDVMEYGKNFIWLEYDATATTPELEALRAKYKIGGLPFVAFFDSKGAWLSRLTLTGFEPTPEFLKRMHEVVDAK